MHGSNLIIPIIVLGFIYVIIPLTIFTIVGYVIYKKLRGATAEEIEMARRINREKEKKGA